MLGTDIRSLTKEGATQVKRLSSLGLHKTMNPYNAYKQGKLVD